jgi:hypothetical protein
MSNFFAYDLCHKKSLFIELNSFEGEQPDHCGVWTCVCKLLTHDWLTLVSLPLTPEIRWPNLPSTFLLRTHQITHPALPTLSTLPPKKTALVNRPTPESRTSHFIREGHKHFTIVINHILNDEKLKGSQIIRLSINVNTDPTP